MIENLKVRKEILEDTTHERLHFELTLDEKEYQGYFKDGDVSWFQMQPNQENHEMQLVDLEAAVSAKLASWKENQQTL